MFKSSLTAQVGVLASLSTVSKIQFPSSNPSSKVDTPSKSAEQLRATVKAARRLGGAAASPGTNPSLILSEDCSSNSESTNATNHTTTTAKFQVGENPAAFQANHLSPKRREKKEEDPKKILMDQVKALTATLQSHRQYVPGEPHLFALLTPEEMQLIHNLSEELQYACRPESSDAASERSLTLIEVWKTFQQDPERLRDFGFRFGERLMQRLRNNDVDHRDPNAPPFIPEVLMTMTPEKRGEFLLGLIEMTVKLYQSPLDMIQEGPRIGALHIIHGIDVPHFYLFRNVFISLLREILPPETFALCEDDCTRFWALTVDLMTHGVSTPTGRLNKELFLSNSAAQALELLQRAVLLQKSLPHKKQLIPLAFRRAAKKDPSYAPFAKMFTKSPRRCERMLQAVLHVAAHAREVEPMLIYLQEIGARHDTYNVSEAAVKGIIPHFLFAMEKILPKKMWSTSAYYHLHHFFAFLADGIAAGLDAGKNTGENQRAPHGQTEFCLLFTDIESSTNLWQRNSDIMKSAVEQHHRIIRTIIADYGGYEVKTAGDSFLIAAKDMLVGLKIAVAIQLELMRNLPIVPGFEMLDEVQGGGDPSAWSNQTLRVRIGMEHCTQATATYDTIHRRYDYYGPSVNQCARIEAAAAGGQILMSRESFKALKAIPEFHTEPCPPYLRDLSGATPMDDRGLDHFVAVCDVGKAKLKGISKPVRLASMVPLCLSGRRFNPPLTK